MSADLKVTRAAKRPAKKTPAAPKPERMSAADVEAEIQRVHVLLPFLLGLKLDELAREFEIYDTVTPLFDPTSWLRGHRDVERNRDIVHALRRARDAIKKRLEDVS